MLLRVWSISHRVTAHGKSQLLLSEIGTDDSERRQSPFVFVTARGEANTDKDAVLPGHVDSRGGFIAEATIHEAAISRGLL